MPEKSIRNVMAFACRLPLPLLVAAQLFSHRTLAAEAGRFAAPVEPVINDTAGGMLRVVVSLFVVLALVFGAAWLIRKLRVAQGAVNGGMQIISQVSLGARERVVLLRIGDRDLLLGVAPGSVRTLLTLESGAAATQAPGADAMVAAMRQSTPAGGAPSFRELLRRSLGR